MDNERTADVLQVALASYDRKELRVQKNYLEEQNPVLACTCFLNGHKLLQELQQGHNFDIVVLCSQMEDMSSIEFMMELRKLEHKPLLMLFDEGRRKNSSALRMEDSGSCCCVERMELKNLLRELYRMPGQQWQRTEQQCQQLYHSWGIRIPDINCSYLTSAVGVVYGTSQKLAIRKEILQTVSGQGFQNRQHGSSLGLGGRQIHVAVVAALHFAGTGHGTLKGGHKAEGLHGQLQSLRRGQAAGQQVKAGAAAHGAHIDHTILKGTIACVGGKQVLQRVGSGRGQVIALVGLLHADVPSEHVAVLTAQVHAPVQLGMVNTEARNAFHCVALFLRPAGAARCRVRSPQRSSGRHGCERWHPRHPRRWA